MRTIMWEKVALFILGLAALCAATDGNIHQDSRCNCVCPDTSSFQQKPNNNSNNAVIDRDAGQADGKRTIYINSSVTPDECTCENVVLVHLDLTDSQADSFCPRCSCKYQTRSLTVIKVVVIIVLWMIFLLLFYMAFLSLLEPFLAKRRGIGLPNIRPGGGQIGYSEHHDEEASTSSNTGANGGDSGRGSVASNEANEMKTYHGAEGVINRLGSQQSKWKKQVQEQRRNIYDRHAMLN